MLPPCTPCATSKRLHLCVASLREDSSWSSEAGRWCDTETSLRWPTFANCCCEICRTRRITRRRKAGPGRGGPVETCSTAMLLDSHQAAALAMAMVQSRLCSADGARWTLAWSHGRAPDAIGLSRTNGTTTIRSMHTPASGEHLHRLSLGRQAESVKGTLRHMAGHPDII